MLPTVLILLCKLYNNNNNFTSTSWFADQDHAEFVINIDEFKFAGGEGNTQFGSDVTDSSTHPQLKSRLWQLWRAEQLGTQLAEGDTEHSPPIFPCFILLCFFFILIILLFIFLFAGAGMANWFRALDLKPGVPGSKPPSYTYLSWTCSWCSAEFNSVTPYFVTWELISLQLVGLLWRTLCSVCNTCLFIYIVQCTQLAQKC